MRTGSLALLLLAGCAHHGGGETWVETDLYFGLSLADGGAVSDADWDAFVQQVVTPAFPEGYTVVDATGHWRNGLGEAVSEDSRVLVVLHPKGEAADSAVESIRAAYKDRFHQESVLRVDAPATVSF